MIGGPPALMRRLALALAFPIMGYALFVTGQQAMEGRRMEQQVAALQQNVDGLRNQNIRLQNELMYRRSDEYVEQVAREQLGMAKPGDVVVNLVGDNIPPRSRPDPRLSPAPAPAEQPSDRRGPPLDAWLDYFFGR